MEHETKQHEILNSIQIWIWMRYQDYSTGTTLISSCMAVEEKLGEQNFRVFSEMRGKILYIDPKNIKFGVEIGWKSRNRCCQNLISIFEKFSFEQMMTRTSKPEIRFRFWILVMEFWILVMEIQNLSQKIWKIRMWKPEIRFRFGFFGPGNWFWKFKNHFLQFLSNFDLGPKNLKSPSSKTPKSFFFRSKILIFDTHFSSTNILILY